MTRILSIICLLIATCVASETYLADCPENNIDKGLRTFFRKAQTIIERDDVTAFIGRYKNDVVALKLTTCHAVYQLLGVLTTQLEKPFRDIASTLLASYEAKPELLYEWTGYRWGGEAAKDKNAEVVRTIQLMDAVQQAPTDAEALQLLHASSEKSETFFTRSIVAAHAENFPKLTAQAWTSFAKGNREMNLFCVSYALLRESPLARILSLRRYNQAEKHMEKGDCHAADAARNDKWRRELGLTFMMCELGGRELSWSACLLQNHFAQTLCVDTLNKKYDAMGGINGDEKAIDKAQDEFLIGQFLTDAIITQYLQDITGYKGG